MLTAGCSSCNAYPEKCYDNSYLVAEKTKHVCKNGKKVATGGEK